MKNAKNLGSADCHERMEEKLNEEKGSNSTIKIVIAKVNEIYLSATLVRITKKRKGRE
jgi:ferritin-like metal-binding protein YciE